MDNLSIPAFLRPINAPSPAIHFKDIIGVKPTVLETKDIRQKRIDKLDNNPNKKPLLAIKPQSTEDEAKDTIKILEDLLKKPSFVSPKKKEDSLKGVGAFIQGSPIKSKQPSKLSDVLKKSPTTEAAAAEEPNDSNLDESPELRALKDNFKKDGKYQYNWEMGQLLIDNDIRDPKTGNKFYINPSNKVLVRGGDRAIDKEGLKDVILKSFNDKKIKKF